MEKEFLDQLFNQYVNLMMGVLIASTALCGLTSVVVGQIRGSPDIDINEKKAMVGVLSASFFCGIVAIILTIIWFSSPSVDIFSLFSETSWAPFLLLVQIVLLAGPIGTFWYSIRGKGNSQDT